MKIKKKFYEAPLSERRESGATLWASKSVYISHIQLNM